MKLFQASYSFKMMICFIQLILAGRASSAEGKCPFKYLYHFGDAITDIGNTVHILSLDHNPSAHWPYGITYPGYPTGRWCDGRIDMDYAAEDFGIPIAAYLQPGSEESDGVLFSVARSPVLPHAFFSSKGIKIPSFAVPLETQMTWFRTHLKKVCHTPTGCKERLANSLVLMGDTEGNDIGYALTQGKSAREVTTYFPLIVQTMINASREIIKLGTTRLIIPGNGPLGCYPYILTALQTHDSTAYDELGCLKYVNDLVTTKNGYVEEAVKNLQVEFPNATIYFGPLYDPILNVINDSSAIGPDGINKALKTCCGIGGSYNYDNERFCGSSEATVCSNPKEYIFWDGIHLTQETYRIFEQVTAQPALARLNCTTTSFKNHGIKYSYSASF